MKRYIVSISIGLILLFSNGITLRDAGIPSVESVPVIEVDECKSLYQSAGLEGEVDIEIFRKAYDGYLQITERQRDLLTLIDFSKPSNQERLYVIDMSARQLLYRSVVAHGRNSGNLYATDFSNRPNSHQSSLGFYLTAETYQGGNGYSLRLNGLERGYNDKARERAIVIHGAKYADPSVCQNGNRLGRSFGCPALPESLNRPIIDAIKGGSVLFIYAEDQSYLANSRYLNPASGDRQIG